MATHVVGTRSALILFAIAFCIATSAANAEDGFRYFVQPDSAVIETARTLLINDPRWPKGTDFVCVGPGEPSKSWRTQAPSNAGMTIAFTGYHAPTHQLIEAIVDHTNQRVRSCDVIRGRKPMITGTDFTLTDSLVKADARWQAAVRKRGFTDPSQLVVDGWASGIVSTDPTQRIVRGITYALTNGVNQYDRPLEGIICHIDLDGKKVLDVFDHGMQPVAEPSAPYENITISPEPLVPLTIKHERQPFVIDGQHITWQGWSFRYLVHPREGLVLYDITLDVNGTPRSVAWRIGLSEMFVPYGDSAVGWYWRNAFDVGEYGVGVCSWSLSRGEDVPDETLLLPVATIARNGDVSTMPDVIGIYERDGGMFLRHRDPNSFKLVSRRGRELVITHTATVGNYDYAISYIFGLDGGIRVETRLSGIMLVKGTSEEKGMLVAKNIAAPYHQHFFNFRLDLDVDGTANTVHELDVWSPPTPSNENPRGNTIMLDNYEYMFELEARASINTKMSRSWMVAGTTRTNFNGEPTAYMLMPGSNAFPYIDSLALPRTRARFVDHHLWATVHKDNELYAAGPYPNQNAGGEGLPQYIADNEPLHGKDVVLWYTMGITHITRPEDWPIMPVHTAGFSLVPMNFR